MLSREARFTETRPIAKWTLEGIEAEIHNALLKAREHGAPEIPDRVSIQPSPPSDLPGTRGSLFVQVIWGEALETARADGG